MWPWLCRKQIKIEAKKNKVGKKIKTERERDQQLATNFPDSTLKTNSGRTKKISRAMACSSKGAAHRRLKRRKRVLACFRSVRLVRTNLTVERLSLNRSQCGGCSTKYDTPTDELGRLRMILHRCIASGGHHLRPAAASLPTARG